MVISWRARNFGWSIRSSLSVLGRITITYLVTTSPWIALAVLAISTIEYSAGYYARHGFAPPTDTPLRPMLAYLCTYVEKGISAQFLHIFCC